MHGYRPGALDALPGFSPADRAALRPGLVEVSLSAYGGDAATGGARGPWAGRRGFDSLVQVRGRGGVASVSRVLGSPPTPPLLTSQMSCGIANAGRTWAAAAGSSGSSSSTGGGEEGAPPVPLPVQALDHAAGYILAAAAIRGLTLRTRAGQRRAWRGGAPRDGDGVVAAFSASTSLARVAALLMSSASAGPSGTPLLPPQPPSAAPPHAAAALVTTDADYDSSHPERTAWGDGLRLKPPVLVEGCPLAWALPASALGSDVAEWE